MDVVIIFNGLGNQMSQYAFYMQKKALNKATYCISFCSDHNGLELDTVFNIKIEKGLKEKCLYILFRILLTDKLGYILKPIQKLLAILNCKIIKENFDYNFKEAYLKSSKGITFYYGGWHSEKYFSAIKNELLQQFKFTEIADITNVSCIKKIKATNSVALHIRRGDYLSPENLILFGKVCNLAYFEAAIKTIQKQIDKPSFFIFSNDMHWVEANLHIDDVTYIDHNKGFNSWKDMYLMSICQHNIISNSSFSWWGAWLNTNLDKIVISPRRYLNDDINTDFYPESWIKMSYY